MRKVSTILFATAAAILLSAPALAQVTLKASHQFPGGKGDPRDEMVQIIAKEAKAANVGLEIQVYPGASLFKPNDQWNAIVNGQLELTALPLDYASGKVGAFSDCKASFPGREGEVIEGRYRVVRIGVESAVLEYLDGTGRTTLPLNGQACVKQL